jgi:hypothetical protein
LSDAEDSFLAADTSTGTVSPLPFKRLGAPLMYALRRPFVLVVFFSLRCLSAELGVSSVLSGEGFFDSLLPFSTDVLIEPASEGRPIRDDPFSLGG